MKNGHSEDDTFHTTSNTEYSKRVIFIMRVLPWNWLKWRIKSVAKECCGHFSHPLDVYEARPLDEIFGPTDIAVEIRVKNASQSFCNH